MGCIFGIVGLRSSTLRLGVSLPEKENLLRLHDLSICKQSHCLNTLLFLGLPGSLMLVRVYLSQ